MREDKPHGSYSTYQILKGKMIKDVSAYLRHERSRGEWLIILVIIVMAGMAGVFSAYQLDLNFVHKPLEIIGVCEPSARVVQGNCVLIETQQQTVGGVIKLVNVSIPAGHFYLLNGSSYGGG